MIDQPVVYHPIFGENGVFLSLDLVVILLQLHEVQARRSEPEARGTLAVLILVLLRFEGKACYYRRYRSRHSPVLERQAHA
jgi:hypothetical protein